MQTNYAVAPGEFLQEWLDEESLTQEQAALLLGYSRKQVNAIVNGRAPVSNETATRLARVTGIPVDSWLGFELAYRADLARLADERALAAHIDEIPDAVATYLRKHDHTTATRRHPGRLVADFLAFHRCGTFEAWLAQVEALTQGDYALAALKESGRQPDKTALSTWLRAGELTEHYGRARLAQFREDDLRNLLPQLRERCAHPDATLVADVQAMLAEVGVAWLFVDPPEPFPLHGVTRWIDRRVPVIQQTGRRRTDGFIIWTLFHEIGHVLNDPRGELHLEYTSESRRTSAAERAANAFARECLFGSAGTEPFKDLTRDADIARVASEVGVSPGVAVFMLHRQRRLPYNRGNALTVELLPIT